MGFPFSPDLFDEAFVGPTPGVVEIPAVSRGALVLLSLLLAGIGLLVVRRP
ncbi:MAG: IPTL-CTERM sorting domain-containing protein [Thermoanaerobaculia bacterium]|nr:IPTL-CTERM sorting domain-containing protein [Thermoanaerobaculia bacterium]